MTWVANKVVLDLRSAMFSRLVRLPASYFNDNTSGALLSKVAYDVSGVTGAAGWLVLGDMRELGDDAAALHAEAGRQARAVGLGRLYALGPLAGEAARAFGEGGRVFESHGALAEALGKDIAAMAAPTTVLVKGSRGSAMDRIVAAVLATQGKGDTDAA